MNESNKSLIDRLDIYYELAVENYNTYNIRDRNQAYKWELRKNYIYDQIINFKTELHGKIPSKRIFISYRNKERAKKFYTLLKNGLDIAGFITCTGFGIKENQYRLVESIRSEIQSSSIFIAIFTCENDIIIDDKMAKAPSIWTIEEKGMALGMKIPILILYDKEIHKKFYTQTTGNVVHLPIENDSHFKKTTVPDAVLQVKNIYRYLLK